VFDFIRSLFKPVAPSGETAKERLRLVLLSDHLSLAPDVVESLKRDLMEVISRYVEIDSAHADVTFEHREREIAMLASIPITGVRERKAPQATVFPPHSHAEEAPEPVAADEQVATEAPVAAMQAAIEEPAAPEPSVAPAVALETVAAPELALEAPKPKPKAKVASPATQTPIRASNAAAPRRRRRKKFAAASAAAAAAKSPAQQQQLGNQASAQG
jgi:cell division topological specificity factor